MEGVSNPSNIVLKTLLKISLLANLALLAGLALTWYEAGGRKQTAHTRLSARVKTEADASAMARPPEIASRVDSTPFHWSQLQAKDYHVFVRNLRAVGCPETTVESIVAGHVHAAYRGQVEELEKELSDLDKGTWATRVAAFKEEAVLKEEINKVPDEEAAEIADLLGRQTSPVERRSATGTETTRGASHRQGQVEEERPVLSPLVLQDMDLTALNLDADQQQAIASIRQDFLQQIGGTNQDPNDPAYLARWQQAQPAADVMLETMLGNDLYTRIQLEAHQKYLESQAGLSH